MRQVRIILLIAVSSVARPAEGVYVCQNLEGSTLIAAEARVQVFHDQGEHIQYVHAYFDGPAGDELAISRGGIAGGVDDMASANLWIYAYVYAEDLTGDNWIDAKFTFDLQGSNSENNDCPSGATTNYSTTLVIDTTSGHDLQEAFFGGHFIGFGGANAKRYWRNIISTSLFGDTHSDDGCFEVSDNCQLEEHF